MDLAPLRKRHVPSMLMATYDSVSSDTSTKGGILEVLLSLASSASAGVYLVEHAGILSWLRLLLSSPGLMIVGLFCLYTRPFLTSTLMATPSALLPSHLAAF